MGAGFAQGLSRFGQVAGPVEARGMQTRQSLLAAALERALKEQQIKQARTQNVLSGLAVPGATLEAKLAGEQMAPEAGARRQRTAEAGTARAEAESSRAVRGEKIGQDFDYPMAKQKLEQAEREAKVSRFQLELLEQYGKENAEREQRVSKLKEQALVAGDPVAMAGIEKALREESLKQEKARTKVMKSVEELNRFKAAGGGKEQKPLSVDERQVMTGAAKNIASMATVQTKNPQDPKKLASVPIVTPGAAQNMAATALNYARQGDRAEFDKYVSMESAKLANRVFSDNRKASELLVEYNKSKESKPVLWWNKEIGKTPGTTIPEATTFEQFKAQRKAEAQQAIKDELEAIWTMGQATRPARPTSLEQLGGMGAEEEPAEAGQPDPGSVQDFINGLAAQGVPAEQIRQQVKEQFGI